METISMATEVDQRNFENDVVRRKIDAH